MPRPIHFEIPVSDPERAIAFYQGVFGWKFSQWGQEKYWLVTTGPDEVPGINGGMLMKQSPNQPQTNTISVSHLEGAIEAVTGAGGVIAVPRMPVPGIGWLAYALDPDGNLFGMMQPDPQAK